MNMMKRNRSSSKRKKTENEWKIQATIMSPEFNLLQDAIVQKKKTNDEIF